MERFEEWAVAALCTTNERAYR